MRNLKTKGILTLVPFLRQKAMEKGIKTCPNCGYEDIFFALNGMCLECNTPIEKNNREKTLQFAIEVLREFLDGYDEMFSIEQKKRSIQFLEELVHTLTHKNNLENEKIVVLQSIVKSIGQIGGKGIGGGIKIESGKPVLLLLKNYRIDDADPMARIKSLSGVILSLQFILEYPVIE